jgi:GTP-binding protein
MTRIRSNSMSAPASAGLPVLAIVGRPNVGKSTLFNRIVGSRRAIVGDEPGITRDRLYGEAQWRGQRLSIVDTGGIIPDDESLIPSAIFTQAKVALEEADAIIMVVDGRTELTAPDLDLARLLIRGGKPLFLAVNKIDTDKQQRLIDEFHRLGIRKIFPVSAEHGRGTDDILDAIFESLKLETSKPDAKVRSPEKVARDIKAEQEEESKRNEPSESSELETSQLEALDLETLEPASEESRERQDFDAAIEAKETKVAIIGHPNVGKSTLLNRLTGTSRAIVSPIPGTTRDAVDEIVEHDGKEFRFIDTAGIRRKGKTHLMAEKLSVVMARKHLEAADIALMVIDATEGVSALDATIAGYAHESGRSVIIIVNKWDLVISGAKKPVGQSKAARMQESKRPGDKAAYEERLRYGLKFLSYAPVLFVSAETGVGTEKIWPMLEKVAAERRKRVGTGEMNRFLKRVDFERASVPAKQQVRIYYMTQAAVSPPTFVLFTDRKVKLHFAYQRFLENQIRDAFQFVGTPIWIKNRARD